MAPGVPVDSVACSGTSLPLITGCAGASCQSASASRTRRRASGRCFGGWGASGFAGVLSTSIVRRARCVARNTTSAERSSAVSECSLNSSSNVITAPVCEQGSSPQLPDRRTQERGCTSNCDLPRALALPRRSSARSTVRKSLSSGPAWSDWSANTACHADPFAHTVAAAPACCMRAASFSKPHRAR